MRGIPKVHVSMYLIILYFSFKGNNIFYNNPNRICYDLLRIDRLWKSRILSEREPLLDKTIEVDNVREKEEASESENEETVIIQPSKEAVERGKLEQLDAKYNAYLTEGGNATKSENPLNNSIELMKHIIDTTLNPNHYNLIKYMHRFDDYASTEFNKVYVSLTHMYFHLDGAITVGLRKMLPLNIRHELNDLWERIQPLPINAFLDDEELNNVINGASDDVRRYFNLQEISKNDTLLSLINKCEIFLLSYHGVCVIYETFGIEYVSNILPSRLVKIDLWNKIYTESNLQNTLNFIDASLMNIDLLVPSNIEGRILELTVALRNIDRLKFKANEILYKKIKRLYKYFRRDHNGTFSCIFALMLHTLKKAEYVNQQNMKNSINMIINEDEDEEDELKRNMLKLLYKESVCINKSMQQLKNYLKEHFDIELDMCRELHWLSNRLLGFSKIGDIFSLFEEITTGIFDLSYLNKLRNILSSTLTELNSYISSLSENDSNNTSSSYSSFGDDINLFFTRKRIANNYSSFLHLETIFLKLMHHDSRIHDAMLNLHVIHLYGLRAKAKLKILNLVKEKLILLLNKEYANEEERHKLEKEIVVLLFIVKTKHNP